MAETPRTQALKQLAQRMPAASPQVAAGLQRAQTLQLQQVAPQVRTGRQAQQAGAAVTAATGQQAVAAQQRQQAQATQLGQLGMAEQARQTGAEVEQRKLGLQKQSLDNAATINNMAREAGLEQFQNEMEFRKDQAGQTLWNEQQLADWAMVKAKSENELKKYAQDSQQALDKKISMLEAVQSKLSQALEADFKIKGQKLSQDTKAHIKQQQRELDERIAKEKAKAANTAMIWETASKLGPVLFLL